jgi:hypothetical protein
MKKNQTNHKRVTYSLSLVALLLISGVTVASEPVMEDFPALIVINDESVEIGAVIDIVEELNGIVLHIFPPRVIIGYLSTAAEDYLLQDSAFSVYKGPVDIAEHEDWEKETKYAVTAWNNNYMGLSVDAGLNEPPVSPEPPINDTETVPDLSPYLVDSHYDGAFPHGAGLLDTSEYLIGSVAVGVLFLESNGAIDEDTEEWTEEEEANVTSEIQNGLNWLLSQESHAHIQVVYEWHYSVPVSYEPISRDHTDDDLWEQQAMHHLGYTNSHYLVNEYFYANDLRQKYNTDWAFIIFMVDDSEDTDNAFEDAYYAYSFIGGPRMVATYSNSIWGIANLDSIVAHETCHIFWALDQHCTSEIEQDAASGYLAGENLNSEWNGESCTVTAPSLMKGEPMYNTQIEVSTRIQLGWRDSDSDGVLDILDTIPGVAATVYKDSCTGTARVSPLPNENPLKEGTPITLNTVIAVEYRVDQGDWTAAAAIDGNFDEPEEAFEFVFSLETIGEHTVEVKAQNSSGNWSEPEVKTVNLVQNPFLTSEIVVSPAVVNSGDSVSVVMIVENTGDATALSVEPLLTVPDVVVTISDPEPAYSDIPAGDSVAFEWKYEVLTVEENTLLTFSGNATGHTETGAEVSSESTESNTVEVHVEPLPHTDITALLYGVIEDSTITVIMEVENAGEITLEDVTPSTVAVTSTGTASASLLTGPLPQPPLTLEPGEMKTFEWKYAASSGPQGGTAVFTATVSGKAEGDILTSDVAKATVGIGSPAIVTTFLISTPRQVQVGDILTVAMTVQNIGQSAAVDVVPSEISVSGTGEVELESGPSRPSVKVEGHSFEIILWHYIAVKEGTVTFSGSVQGVDTSTGESLSVPIQHSNTVTITRPEESEEPGETEEPEEPEQTEETGETGESESELPEPTQCPIAKKTIQKVKELLEKARTLLKDKESQRKDTRICKRILKEAELYLGQAQSSLQKGACEEANRRAIMALMKVYELLNCLNYL